MNKNNIQYQGNVPSEQWKRWNSRWDISVFLIAVLISLILLGQKSIFLASIIAAPISLWEFVQLVAVNASAYLAICAWAYLLLSFCSHWFIRIYVLVLGLVFTTLTRMVEGGVESTRQGVDFELVNHLFLALLGHQGLAEVLILLSFQWALFLLLFLGLLMKYSVNKKYASTFPKFVIVVFLFASVCAFFTPLVKEVPRSMAQNGLVTIVKTAWFPIKDVRAPSAFKFSDTADKSTSEGDAIAASAYSGLAKNMNVVVIALESTSANMLDFYPGNDAFEGTSPNLSKLAENSLLINETSSVMTSTSKSIVSILCGIEPYLKTDVFEVTMGIPVDCLPKRLSAQGYDTVFFQSATKFYEGRDRLVAHTGFNTFISVDDLPKSDKEGMQAIGPLGLEDKVLLKEHGRWLESQSEKNKPFMAFYLTLSQHHPYLPMSHDPSFQQRSENRYMNDFVNSLFYIDEFIGQIIEQYKSQGLYENTLFVIVGDHGEGFGRYHKPWFHNNNMYREGLWVPFFISNEKLFSQMSEVKGEFSLRDVAPSVEDLLGIKLASNYRGETVFNNNSKRVNHAACWYENRCLVRMDADYKYIYNYGDSPDELYDRKQDFREQFNLAQERPDIAKHYQQALFAWYSDILAGHEYFYSSQDKSYLTKPESYYQFPAEILPNKKEMERW